MTAQLLFALLLLLLVASLANCTDQDERFEQRRRVPPAAWGKTRRDDGDDDDGEEVPDGSNTTVDPVYGKLLQSPQNEHPWVVYISYGQRIICSGSIIHPRWVLTAARCYQFDYRWRTTPVVVTGTIHFANNLYGGIVYQIEFFVKHPLYEQRPEMHNGTSEYSVNDLALIRTTEDIKFSDRVSQVLLASTKWMDYGGKRGATVGWGRKNYFYPSDRLLNVRVTMLSQYGCKSSWPFLQQSHLCTTNEYIPSEMCLGDAGAPLIRRGIQIGVFSTSDLLCEGEKPDLYTRVSEYVPWIEDQLKAFGEELEVHAEN